MFVPDWKCKNSEREDDDDDDDEQTESVVSSEWIGFRTKYYDNTEEAKAFIDLPSRLHNRYFLVRHGRVR